MNSDDRAGMDRIRALPQEQRKLLALRMKQGLRKPGTAPITLRRDRSQAPLAPDQERVWLINQLVPRAPAFNISYSQILTGTMDMPVLCRSVDEIVRRHESLRTTIEWLGDRPVQRIHEPGDLPLALEITDLSDLPDAERREKLIATATRLSNAPFNLETGPLMRANVFKYDDSTHVLLVSIHHIATDNLSMGIFQRELAELYRSFSRGEPSPLAELPIQYGDFAAWQQEYLQGERLDRLLDYWKQQLEGAPLVLALPTDRPRPSVQTLRGERRYFNIPRDLREKLMALAEAERVSPYIFYLAVFGVLLYRYSGQDDFLVGSPFANRNRTEIRGLIGYLLNLLPMRLDLGGDPTFRELLGKVRQVAFGAYANHDLPFVRLLDLLDPAVDLSRNPVFQHSFIFLDGHDQQLEPSEPAVFSDRDIDFHGSRFDLTLVIAQSTNAAGGFIEYSSDLWDRASVDRMLGHLRQCLEGVAANPDFRVAAIPLMPESERRMILEEWNSTAKPYPDVCLHELFEAQVGRSPDAVAVVYGESQLSYRELNARSNRLAHRLRALGVSRDTLVGLCVGRSLERVVGVLGILKAGGAYLPLDPEYPPARLAIFLEDTSTPVVVVQSGLQGRLPPYAGQIVELDMQSDCIGAEQVSNPGRASDPRDLAYVMFTSGSTGRPKGVCIEHGSLVNLMESMREHPGLDASDVLVSVTTLSFDMSGVELYLPLLAGARLVVASREEARDGVLLAALLESNDATVLQGTPATWRLLLDSGWEGNSSLKALCGGEPMPMVLGKALLERVGSLWNLYGPTETTIWSTVEQVDEESFGSTVSVGRPIANTRVYVLDDELKPVPVGVPGELCIGGVGVARGYWESAPLTAQRFVEDPFMLAGGRLYRTGDLARWRADGRLEHLGRMDYQVKVRGFRIELGEVEATLERHPSVDQAVVTTREMGELASLAAYVVSRERDARALDTHVREHLPGYMVPAAWVFLDRLPLTPNGKVDRWALPDPENPGLGVADDYLAPRNGLEEVLCQIWCEVLGLERVSIGDDFIALGGHSLMAARVISRVANVLGIELSLLALFEASTVAGLSERIARARATGMGSTPVERVPRDGPLALSFGQERLWFLEQMVKGNAAYNIPLAVRLRGRLDRAALAQALSALVERHEVLRTSFRAEDGRPLQIVEPAERFRLQVEDLAPLGHEKAEQAVSARMQDDALEPFELGRAPMLRARLLTLDEADNVLLLCLHHIAADGWSMGVMLAELGKLYRAFSRGEPSPLPDLPVQYADYAAWQRDRLGGEYFSTLLSYWRQRLQGIETLELPTDHPRPPVETFRGGWESMRVDPELTARLQALGRENGATLFMVMLSGLAILLGRYSGQEDIVVGIPVANRPRPELEGLIGFFVNSLVMRVDLAGDPAARQLLHQVREATLEAYAHQDMPFERLVEVLRPNRDLSRNPLFQSFVSMQNMPLPSMDLGDLQLSGMHPPAQATRFDLEFYLAEVDGGVTLDCGFNADLFEAATVAAMLSRYQRVLEFLVSTPEKHISALDLLTVEERDCQLNQWNDTDFEVPIECVQQLFEIQASRVPDAVAVVAADRTLSYRELASRADRLAARLLQLGVSAGDRVGVCLDRSSDLPAATLAVMKAGACYVPLDPSLPAQRLSYMAGDAGISLLLTRARLAESLDLNGVPILDTDRVAHGAKAAGSIDVDAAPDDVAYVIYTSGSTGRPKGVQITHGALTNFLCSMRDRPGCSEQDTLLSVTSIAFDISGLELYLPLIVGARVVLLEEDSSLDPAAIAVALDRHQATVMQATPATWRMLQSADWRGRPELKVLCGGEPVTPALAVWLRERAGSVWNLYGPTEATIWSTVEPVSSDSIGSSVSIGRPIANTRIYLLDNHLQPVPVGIPGELYIGGAGVAAGYWNRPQLDQERFVQDPYAASPGARMYRTGDLARYRADGRLDFIGRVDYQVKLRGFRIEPGEIETLLQSHPAVSDAVVLCREDDPGNPRLVAYCVASLAGMEPILEASSEEQLREWHDLWDGVYQGSTEWAPDLDFSGWNSSYSGEPIPQAEMREWVDATVARIRGLGPRSVMEIGCGTGLLLGRLAPECDRYLGMDFSGFALARVRTLCAARDDLSHVELLQREAGDFTGLEPGVFDTVVINSVVQYLPSVEHMSLVLTGALSMLAPGGRVFVGDVRNLPLLGAYHADVQINRCEATMGVEELGRRVRDQLARETELVVDPAFFEGVAARNPRQIGVEVLLKRGVYENELTRYRYDAILHVEVEGAENATPRRVEWAELGSVAAVEALLGQAADAVLTVRGIPNARVAGALELWRALNGDLKTCDRRRLDRRMAEARDKAVNPAILWAIAEERGWTLELEYSGDGSDGRMHALLWRDDRVQHRMAVLRAAQPDLPIEDLSAYCTQPLRARLYRRLSPALREYLQTRIPDYMLPSAFVLLDRLPLTANGKLDRRALPMPDDGLRSDEIFVEPRSDLERQLTEIWREVLGVTQIGIHDNFFKKGGHSLLAMQVISRIRQRLTLNLSVISLFEYSTVALLAAYIETLQWLSEIPASEDLDSDEREEVVF